MIRNTKIKKEKIKKKEKKGRSYSTMHQQCQLKAFFTQIYGERAPGPRYTSNSSEPWRHIECLCTKQTCLWAERWPLLWSMYPNQPQHMRSPCQLRGTWYHTTMQVQAVGFPCFIRFRRLKTPYHLSIPKVLFFWQLSTSIAATVSNVNYNM